MKVELNDYMIMNEENNILLASNFSPRDMFFKRFIADIEFCNSV